MEILYKGIYSSYPLALSSREKHGFPCTLLRLVDLGSKAHPRDGHLSSAEDRRFIHIIPGVEHSIGAQKTISSEEIRPPIDHLRTIEVWPVAGSRPTPTIKVG